MGNETTLSSLLSMTDEQAMWRVQTQDDPRAFAQLVNRWETPILRLCARLTGDVQRGEDLKQEAFARVFARRRDYRQGMRFSTWLWRIALNLCLNEQRYRRVRKEASLEEIEARGLTVVEGAAEAPDPAEQAATDEEHALIRRALHRLPEMYRAVLVLRFCEKLKLRDIAEVLEIPEGTVCSRLAEGLARLTRLLEPQFGRTTDTVPEDDGNATHVSHNACNHESSQT